MALALLLIVGPAQDGAEKAKALLEAVAAEMKDAPAISFYCQIRRTGREDMQEVQVSLKRPNLGRFTFSDGEQDYHYILDGKTFWRYFLDRNEYSKMPQTAEQEKSVWAGIVPILYFFKPADLPEFDDKASCAEETVDEQKFDVVRWGPDGKYAVWIDPEKTIRKFRMVTKVKGETVEKIVECGDVDLKPELEEDAFSFTPPMDAKETKEDD